MISGAPGERTSRRWGFLRASLRRLNHVKGEIEGTYNLYNYWPERRQALGLWHEKLTRLKSEARQRAA